jgi:hypothetical protein
LLRPAGGRHARGEREHDQFESEWFHGSSLL